MNYLDMLRKGIITRLEHLINQINDQKKLAKYCEKDELYEEAEKYYENMRNLANETEKIKESKEYEIILKDSKRFFGFKSRKVLKKADEKIEKIKKLAER